MQSDLFAAPAVVEKIAGTAAPYWDRYTVMRSAWFSEDGAYRWALTRVWKPGPIAISAGLNPSTANALQDDPTIHTESVQFDMLGFGGLLKLNVFGFKATEPKDMKKAPDPVGRDNDAIFEMFLCQRPSLFVATWGMHGRYLDRDLKVLAMLARHRVTPMCFAITMSGMPRHPLYLPHGTKLIPYDVSRRGQTIERPQRGKS